MNWEELLKIVGTLLPVLITGLIGYFQYLNQKSSSQYSENLKLIYSPKKEEVLASIANLNTFRKTRHLRSITQNILINRLYTELDYNVCHAIANQLVTMVDRNKHEELNEIIARLIDINYNYFFQDYGIRLRQDDLHIAIENAEKEYVNQKINKNDELKVIGLIDDLKATVKSKWQEYNEVKDMADYKIIWHKQILADTLGIVISRATKMGFQNITANFIINDFNYCTFRNISIHKCRIERSAFGISLLQEVHLDNLLMEDNAFSSSNYEKCVFSNGIIRCTTFHGSKFNGMKFENLEFDDVCFVNCHFINCTFTSIRGLNPAWFYNARFKGNIPDFASAIDNVTEDEIINLVNNSKFADTRMKSITDYLATLKQPAQSPAETNPISTPTEKMVLTT